MSDQELEELKEAYKKVLSFRFKKRKAVPYRELDLVLYAAERYMEIMDS